MVLRPNSFSESQSNTPWWKIQKQVIDIVNNKYQATVYGIKT